MSHEHPQHDPRPHVCGVGWQDALPSLRQPSPGQVAQWLARQQRRTFTYEAIGATATQPPQGYRVDHTRCLLGQGEAVFAAACDALRGWRQFGLSWLSIASADAPLVPGTVLAIVAKAAGLWWVNPCRIVYVIDEDTGTKRRFGFAYGTLPGHAGRGEECFLVEMLPNGEVHYDILAFSQPGHLLARLGYPLMRRYQKRFGRESASAIRQAVAEVMQKKSGQI